MNSTLKRDRFCRAIGRIPKIEILSEMSFHFFSEISVCQSFFALLSFQKTKLVEKLIYVFLD